MKQKVICKVCGFVMDRAKLGEVCPACGVARKAFEEYKDRVSETRRKMMDLNLHSMVVHFPQAIAVMIFGLMILQLVFFRNSEFNLVSCVQTLAILLPLSVLGAMVTGLMDGKTRFKRLTTPILKLKITVAIIFLVLSAILALLVLYQVYLAVWLYLFLNGICVLFSVILGENGGKLRGLAVPN